MLSYLDSVVPLVHGTEAKACQIGQWERSITKLRKVGVVRDFDWGFDKDLTESLQSYLTGARCYLTGVTFGAGPAPEPHRVEGRVGKGGNLVDQTQTKECACVYVCE